MSIYASLLMAAMFVPHADAASGTFDGQRSLVAEQLEVPWPTLERLKTVTPRPQRQTDKLLPNFIERPTPVLGLPLPN
jgi:hypothetical protein